MANICSTEYRIQGTLDEMHEVHKKILATLEEHKANVYDFEPNPKLKVARWQDINKFEDCYDEVGKCLCFYETTPYGPHPSYLEDIVYECYRYANKCA